MSKGTGCSQIWKLTEGRGLLPTEFVAPINEILLQSFHRDSTEIVQMPRESAHSSTTLVYLSHTAFFGGSARL